MALIAAKKIMTAPVAGMLGCFQPTSGQHPTRSLTVDVSRCFSTLRGAEFVESHAFNEGSYQRGVDYFEQDNVFDAVVRGNILAGVSHGRDGNVYKIFLAWSPNGYISYGHCTCYVGHFGTCKHAVALLLTWIEQRHVFRPAVKVVSLPPSILQRICGYLGPPVEGTRVNSSLIAAATVCRAWRSELRPMIPFFTSCVFGPAGAAINVGRPVALSLAGGPFTVEAWIRPAFDAATGTVVAKVGEVSECNEGVRVENNRGEWLRVESNFGVGFLFSGRGLWR